MKKVMKMIEVGVLMRCLEPSAANNPWRLNLVKREFRSYVQERSLKSWRNHVDGVKGVAEEDTAERRTPPGIKAVKVRGKGVSCLPGGGKTSDRRGRARARTCGERIEEKGPVRLGQIG